KSLCTASQAGYDYRRVIKNVAVLNPSVRSYNPHPCLFAVIKAIINGWLDNFFVMFPVTGFFRGCQLIHVTAKPVDSGSNQHPVFYRKIIVTLIVELSQNRIRRIYLFPGTFGRWVFAVDIQALLSPPDDR